MSRILLAATTLVVLAATWAAPLGGWAPVARADDDVAVGHTAVVASTDGDALQLRGSPGLSGPVQGTLREGTRVQVVEGPQPADGFQWYRVTAGASGGWVPSRYLSAGDDRTVLAAGSVARGPVPPASAPAPAASGAPSGASAPAAASGSSPSPASAGAPASSGTPAAASAASAVASGSPAPASASSAASSGALSAAAGPLPPGGRTLQARVTAYNLGSGARTATGTAARFGTVAVDPQVIPLGTRLTIQGYEGTVFVAEDTGSAVRGNVVDVWLDDPVAAGRFGTQTRTVTVLDR